MGKSERRLSQRTQLFLSSSSHFLSLRIKLISYLFLTIHLSVRSSQDSLDSSIFSRFSFMFLGFFSKTMEDESNSSRNRTNTPPLKQIRTDIGSLYSADLASYNSACSQDSDLQSFDSSLHQRTNRVISSLASSAESRSLSFDALIEVSGCLVEMNQEVVRFIIESREDVWDNKDLTCLVNAYFDSSIKTLDFCNTVDNCVKRARISQMIIQFAIVTLFAIGLWWGWKWRCGYVFGAVGVCRDRVGFVRRLAEETVQAQAKVWGGCGAPERVQVMVRWQQPDDGWMKVNTDGASRGNPGIASAGGVLRDAQGVWCGGFTVNVGICSAPLAELWGCIMVSGLLGRRVLDV